MTDMVVCSDCKTEYNGVDYWTCPTCRSVQYPDSQVIALLEQEYSGLLSDWQTAVAEFERLDSAGCPAWQAWNRMQTAHARLGPARKDLDEAKSGIEKGEVKS